MKRLVKKIAGTTLVLTMGVSGTALAADIDLTGMSLDELVELQNNIVAEIDSRTNVGKDVIPCGVYVVGTDIKEKARLNFPRMKTTIQMFWCLRTKIPIRHTPQITRRLIRYFLHLLV